MKNINIIVLLITGLLLTTQASARTKLVALPDRENTFIRLDHPDITLIQEERTLPLHKGINKIDFSWKGVHIDADSIRLAILQHPDSTRLINVSYPPNEQALVWEIFSPENRQEKIRISYLLSNIDRVITYEAKTNLHENKLDLSSYLVLRNFSGESFNSAIFQLDYGKDFEKGILDGETRRMLFFDVANLNIRKVFTFNAGIHPWEPQKQTHTVGIPVSYELENAKGNQLGQHALWNGKTRIFQNDLNKSTIFLGEDMASFTPVGQKMVLHIGDSRDLSVTQHKITEERSNIRRNRNNHIVLYDSNEEIRIEIENFKDTPATLKIIEPMQGEWEIRKSSHDFKHTNSREIEFELTVPAKGKTTVTYSYVRQNVRG
jgi:hypothetical protein